MAKWSLTDIGLTLGTGGAYGLYKGIKDNQDEDQQKAYNKNQVIYPRPVS